MNDEVESERNGMDGKTKISKELCKCATLSPKKKCVMSQNDYNSLTI